MKYSNFLITAIAIALAMSSCSSDEPATAENNANEVRINATHPSEVSRANDTGFDKGDQIGLYIVDVNNALQPGGNMVNNGCFTYNGSAWTPQRKYYWEKGSYNVYAYYPYSTRVDETDNYVFAIPKDQSTDAAYSSADFLWAKAGPVSASNEAVNLVFGHVMSKVIVNIEKSADYTGDLPSNMEVYIHGTCNTALVDLATGGAAADTRSAIESIKAKRLSATKYTAIVAPQRISMRRPLVEIIAGNVSYMMEGTISFKQGFCHTLTVTLSKSPQQVEIEIGGGITNWD